MEDEKLSIKDWCRILRLKDYTINDNDGSVDVMKGDVDLLMKISKLPIQFNIVQGNFNCGNSGLITLEGSPKKVSGHFHCFVNKLTTLESGPSKVGGDYWCNSNKLISLKGCPMKVGGLFYCGNNPVWDEYIKYDNYQQYMRSIKLKEIINYD
jgi:hypothetical protein